MPNWCCSSRSKKTPQDPVVLAIQANDFKAFESAYQSAQTTDQAQWSTANKIPNRPRTLRAIRYLEISLKLENCDPKIVVALLKDGALLSSQHSSTPITSRRALSDVSQTLPEQHQETLHYLLTYGASLTTVNKGLQATFPHQLIAQGERENLWIFAALNGILIKSIENPAFLTELFEAQKKTNTAHTDIAMMAIDALTQINTPLDDTYQQHQFKRHHPTFSQKMNALATQHAQLPETSTQESEEMNAPATQHAQLPKTSTQEKTAIINQALQSLRAEHLRLSSIDPESADTTQRTREPNSSTSSIKFNTPRSNAPVKTNYTNEFTGCCLAQGRPLA